MLICRFQDGGFGEEDFSFLDMVECGLFCINSVFFFFLFVVFRSSPSVNTVVYVKKRMCFFDRLLVNLASFSS